jgi:hypothetical protein
MVIKEGIYRRLHKRRPRQFSPTPDRMMLTESLNNQSIEQQGFTAAIILPDAATDSASNTNLLAELREARFGAVERLVASYVFFWALSKRVASFPLLRYQHWKSQSRARIMTTAAPVARMTTISTSNSANQDLFDRSKILAGFDRLSL